jgi:hypothetical protein
LKEFKKLQEELNEMDFDENIDYKDPNLDQEFRYINIYI